MKPSDTNTTAAEILAELEARDDCAVFKSETTADSSGYPMLELELALKDDE